MGGSFKDKMQEWKCLQNMPQWCNAKWKLRKDENIKCSYSKHGWECYNPTIKLCEIDYCKIKAKLTCNMNLSQNSMVWENIDKK